MNAGNAVISVQGMSCNHCKMAVEKEVKSLPGIISAEVDLEKATLTVAYDQDQTGVDSIRLAVEEVGFTVL